LFSPILFYFDFLFLSGALCPDAKTEISIQYITALFRLQGFRSKKVKFMCQQPGKGSKICKNANSLLSYIQN